MIDPEKISRYPLKERKSKIKKEDFAFPPSPGKSFREFFSSLPRILSGKSIREVVERIKEAKRKKRAVIFGLGAHFIKCGLSPLLIELMERDFVTCVALNGAGIIHDFEIALRGETSEEVEENLAQGKFGMALETGKILNEVVKKNKESSRGMGEILGEELQKDTYPYRRLSILSSTFRKGIPCTVHVAIGTDVIHQHPEADGESIGEATLLDFYRLVEEVKKMSGGGVYLNIGSQVILPEVFLKAINLVRNLDSEFSSFTTVNLDQISHYRPRKNVVERPRVLGGRGYEILGREELIFPLLAQALVEEDKP